jgi:hypothetical protein
MMPSGEVVLFLGLLAGHLLGDFLMQSDADVLHKRRPWRLAKHVAIVTGMSYLLAGVWLAWQIPLILAVSHAVIDRLKLLAEDLGWKGRLPFLLDQAAHLGILGLIAFVPAFAGSPEVFWFELWGPVYAQACLLVSGAIIAVHGGGYLIGMSIEPYLREVLAAEAKRRAAVEGNADAPTAEGLASGGMAIGQLERALIYFFMLIGLPETVGFLVAAKSVFRFGELSRSRKEAEYILIGTLMSFGWSLLTAWFTQWVGGVTGIF